MKEMMRNNASKLCAFMKENPHDWKEKLAELNVKVKESEEYPLAILNYGVGADFTHPLVREARGIVIRTDSFEPVCWSFNKFCNPHEAGAEQDLRNFDWNRCRCQEKIDGSIVKLFFNPFSGRWQWATNSCLSAADARVASRPDQTYLDVIESAVNYGRIRFEDLTEGLTYTFELVSPQTQVVVKYPEARLYHTGTRNCLTGEELDCEVGVEKPKEYPLKSLADCMKAAEELNRDSDAVTQEGFVVVDAEWNRVKVKSPEYFAMHRISNNNSFSKERIVEILRSGEADVETLANDFPLYSVYFRYYAYRMTELEWNVDRFIGFARGLYEEYGRERKAVALRIKDSKYAAFGFGSLENEKTAAELLAGLSLGRYCAMIPDYEPERVY